jgi:hypothetical protein
MKPEVSKPDLANNWFIQIYFDANPRKFTPGSIQGAYVNFD